MSLIKKNGIAVLNHKNNERTKHCKFLELKTEVLSLSLQPTKTLLINILL